MYVCMYFRTASYREKFGADYFGFWFSGLRGIVLNSPLMIHPEVLVALGCIYVCMYACMCVYVSMMFVCVCVYICMYESTMYRCIYLSTYCMYILYVCMYCMCVRVVPVRRPIRMSGSQKRSNRANCAAATSSSSLTTGQQYCTIRLGQVKIVLFYISWFGVSGGLMFTWMRMMTLPLHQRGYIHTYIYPDIHILLLLASVLYPFASS